jgi:hypothetical protein
MDPTDASDHAARLSGIETVLLDLDGTLYVGSQVVSGGPRGGAVAARPGSCGGTG